MSYPWAYSDPIDGEGMDDEDRYVIEEFEDEPCVTLCQHCGREMEWIDCEQCGGEGEGEYDTEPCAQCGGMGGWWWCDNQECPGKHETARKAPMARCAGSGRTGRPNA
jgi:hypothetical protein